MRRFVIYSLFTIYISTAQVLGYSGGVGDPNDPYQVANVDDLLSLAESPEDFDKHFILTNDIDLSAQEFTQAIIYKEHSPFEGRFDGKGHRISNLHIIGTNYLGLFYETSEEAEIVNVNLEDVNLLGTGDYIGALIVFNTGNVSQCSVSGRIEGKGSVGGLIAKNEGTTSHCQSSSNVSGNYETGGLIGSNLADISFSLSNGIVSGGSVGGLVGENAKKGNLYNCYSTADVNGNSYVGGLVSSNYGNIINCYSSACVLGTGNEVGGLAGSNAFGSIISCYSNGSVVGDGWYVGGLVGENYDASIFNSYSLSDVFGGGEYVGGLVGENSLPGVFNCYSAGRVVGSGPPIVYGDIIIGGLIGHHVDGIVFNSFWDVESSGTSISDGGTGLSTAQIKDVNTLLEAGWDFQNEYQNGTSDYWQALPESYPGLSYAGLIDLPVLNGLGTPQEPFQIRNTSDLGTIWLRPNVCYNLTTSIDLAGITWSTSIAPYFSGFFNGNKHILQNLHIKGEDFVGLFSQLKETSEITDFILKDTCIESNGSYIGGLVGFAFLDYYNNISYNFGTISNCSISGIIDGNEFVGGLVGCNTGKMLQCASTADVSGTRFVGGLSGSNVEQIKQCYSNGKVLGQKTGAEIGGLVGRNVNQIEDCYSKADVSGIESIGGLVGLNAEHIALCYSTGHVQGIDKVGGLVGESPSTRVFNSFWDMDTSGLTISDGGIGLDSFEMKQYQTYANSHWSITDGPSNKTWLMSASSSEDQGYPILSWQRQNSIAFGFENSQFSERWTDNFPESHPWFFTTSEAYSGLYSIRSEYINHNEVASLYFRDDHRPTEIQFAAKVSSEKDNDKLVFKVDDQVIAVWSGEMDWTLVSYKLSGKRHRFEWSYIKNNTISEGQDAAWIDDVILLGTSEPNITRVSDFPEELIFVAIPEGTFEMGNHFYQPWYKNDEIPVHTVTVKKFSISKYEVTNGQYVEFLNAANTEGLLTVYDRKVYASTDMDHLRAYCDLSNDNLDINRIKYDNGRFRVVEALPYDMMSQHPAMGISWFGATAFCTYYGYRLPTEAEWEYAARGGFHDPYFRYSWGDNQISPAKLNYQDSFPYPDVLAPHGTMYGFTSPVGAYGEYGSYGLCDMLGNALEWCQDWFDPDYYSYSPQVNPQGPTTGINKVLRGGSLFGGDYNTYIAYRFAGPPSNATENEIGFRVCLK